MCKAVDCNQNHDKHYCRICETNDSNHCARNCPQGIDLYHGTCVTNIESIVNGHYTMNGGLKMSKDGRLGPGIYFAQENQARKIAKYRGNGTGVAVLKCRVNPNKCKISTHPPWNGVVDYEFKQWCLTQESCHRITKIFMKDGIIYGNLSDGSLSIKVEGNCAFKGNYTKLHTIQVEGNLTIG